MTLPSSVTETPETDSDRVSDERLTYADLREANIARQAAWCPDQVPDLSFRGNELAGETGEVCNVIKKLERERLGWRGSRDTVEHLAEELADVVICADLCALSAGIDLKEAVAAKFNATSEKVGLPHRLTTPSLPPRSGGVVGLPAWNDLPQAVRSAGVEEGMLANAIYNAMRDALIRSTLADPIPEAPADEEVPYDDLPEADKEADRQIGEALTTAFPPVLTAALRRDEGKGVREAVESLPRYYAAYNGLDEGFGTAKMAESPRGEWIRALSAPLAEDQPVAYLDQHGIPQLPARFPQPWRDDPATWSITPLYTRSTTGGAK